MAAEEASPFLEDEDDGDETSAPLYRFPGRENSGYDSGKKSSRGRYIVVGLVALLLLIVFFGVGVFIGYYALPGRGNKECGGGGSNSSTGNITAEICSDPPLLLISLDGFRETYFERNVTPTLQMLYRSGVKAEFMRAVFPTKTFPNHHSIVTGLYPESHGMVGNVFYDSEFNDTFNFTSRTDNLQSKWWGGEPIWVTAALNKLRTAAYFWPGSEAAIKGLKPNYYAAYDPKVPFPVRVEAIVNWLDLPKKERPKFFALYSEEPDEFAHYFGPESSEVTYALSEVDEGIRFLVTELEKRKILDCVNVIIVSDHGMAAYNANKTVNIELLIPPDLRKGIRYLPIGAISNLEVPGGEEDITRVYEGLVAGPAQGFPFRVFLRDQLPLRLHTGLQSTQRYGPIYAIADVHGSMINNGSFMPALGDHGFDNIVTDMHAIFIGHGPYFKKSFTAAGFDNIQVYSLMCDLLNVTPAHNNGSYGALHHLLDPAFAAKLRPPRSMSPLPGTIGQCPFPQDEKELERRSLCDGCICRISSCNVTDEGILMANENLINISADHRGLNTSYHHPWGVPQGGSGEGACLLSQLGYASLYSHTLNIPLWSAYTLDPALVDGDVSVDHWCWRNDPRLPVSGSPNCSTDLWLLNDTNSTYIPAPLLFPMDSSTNISLSMSLLTNVVYMARPFWDGIWNLTMSRIRAWFKTYSVPMNIVIGVVLDANRDGTRDPDSDYANKFMGVAIPTHFYVVITRCGVSSKSLQSCGVEDLKVLGLVLQHPKQPGDYADDEKVLRYSLTSVRDIEMATGVDFFPNLSPADQNTLELGLLDELWTTT